MLKAGRRLGLLDPSAVFSRVSEPALLHVNAPAAEAGARVFTPPAQHDHHQERDCNKEPAAHGTSLRLAVAHPTRRFRHGFVAEEHFARGGIFTNAQKPRRWSEPALRGATSVRGYDYCSIGE